MKFILALLVALVSNVVAQAECQACSDGVGTATSLALGGGDIITLICGNSTLQSELKACIACPGAGADSIQSVDQEAASEYVQTCSSGITGGSSFSSVALPSTLGSSSASASGASSSAVSTPASSFASSQSSTISSVNFGSASAKPSSSSSPSLFNAGFQAVVSVAMLSVVALSSAVYLLV